MSQENDARRLYRGETLTEAERESLSKRLLTDASFRDAYNAFARLTRDTEAIEDFPAAMPVSCEWTERTAAYHGGSLAEELRAAFVRHLPDCGDCRAALRALCAAEEWTAEETQTENPIVRAASALHAAAERFASRKLPLIGASARQLTPVVVRSATPGGTERTETFTLPTGDLLIVRKYDDGGKKMIDIACSRKECTLCALTAQGRLCFQWQGSKTFQWVEECVVIVDDACCIVIDWEEE